MSSARQDLLDRVIAYVAANGMIDASLRTLASGIGTSHRMLIYHFGSREGLIAAIVTTIETQQRVALEDLTGSRRMGSHTVEILGFTAE